MGVGVPVWVAVAVGTDVVVAVALGRTLATGEGVGSSETSRQEYGEEYRAHEQHTTCDGTLTFSLLSPDVV